MLPPGAYLSALTEKSIFSSKPEERGKPFQFNNSSQQERNNCTQLPLEGESVTGTLRLVKTDSLVKQYQEL